MTDSSTVPMQILLRKSIARFRKCIGGKSKSPPRLLHPSARAENIEHLCIASLLVPSGQPLEMGRTYLKLLHGRNRADENLDEWGFNGPTFGPLDWFHITYLQTFRFGRANAEAEIEVFDDMFVWEGKYYGDAEIFVVRKNKPRPLTDDEYSIGVNNDDGDCYDVVIKQGSRPIATLIAPEGDVVPLVHAGNYYATISSALGAAATAIEEASDILHYEDGEAVTFLESREIEMAYVALVSVTAQIKHAVAMCGLQQNAMFESEGAEHV
jgi:hypothetical protein